MSVRKINLSYKCIINSKSSDRLEQMIFNDTYLEFKLQFQNFNDGRLETFNSLIKVKPELENKLNFLVSAGATNHILQLNNLIPGIKNTQKKPFLQFNKYSFEIVESHLQDKSQHEIAITFYSEPMYWLDTLGKYLLISSHYSDVMDTNLLKITKNLNIDKVASADEL